MESKINTCSFVQNLYNLQGKDRKFCLAAAAAAAGGEELRQAIGKMFE
jgi:hypothetical protein